jgi:hypothetical protein
VAVDADPGPVLLAAPMEGMVAPMRNLKERARDPRWWLDQAAHMGLGCALAYAFHDGLPWLGTFGLAASLGILRELLQNLRFAGGIHWEGSLPDAGVDALFWIAGAGLGTGLGEIGG